MCMLISIGKKVSDKIFLIELSRTVFAKVLIATMNNNNT